MYQIMCSAVKVGYPGCDACHGRSVFTYSSPYKLTLGLSLGMSGLSGGEHREGVGQDRKPVKDTSVGPGCLWVAELSVPGRALRDRVEFQHPRTEWSSPASEPD